LRGPVDNTGLTQPHWRTSCISFSIIIHTIVLKLFLETNYWNGYTVGTGVLCVVLYYATVILLNTEKVSELLQPEVNQEYY